MGWHQSRACSSKVGTEIDGSATDRPLSWAPAKVSGRYLSPYLVANDVVHLPPRSDPASGIEISVPLSRQQKRVREDILGLAALGLIARR